MKRIFAFLFFVVMVWMLPVYAQSQYPLKKVLVLCEGNGDIKSFPMGDARQLAELFGHFNTQTAIKGVSKYSQGELNSYDYIFYIGFTPGNVVPKKFTDDVLRTSKPVIWMNTGFAGFSKESNTKKVYGFWVKGLDTLSNFDGVKSGNKSFTKGEPNLNLVEITNRGMVQVLATAWSSHKRREMPYIIRSKNLLYIADSPLASATETDRYLLFSDMLHDIFNEQHPTEHHAMIRIEDVTPMENPEKLKEIADILSSKGIPFLVSTVPFYVDPSQGIRISLSDKPDMVDALKYMVQKGGAICMHGITHQYKGITAADFEFWDESRNKPIKDESPEAFEKKFELGIQEFMKNGLYPVVWETPHYTGSFLSYRTSAKYFSSAVEQRLSIEDFEYGQYMPYIIYKDLFGQKIYPENLGYIPLDPDKKVSLGYVNNLLRGAKANLYVRDGFASCFFHAFLDLSLLDVLVDGVQKMGYQFYDITLHNNWVKTKDRIIMTGDGDYTIKLEDQFLSEGYFNENGELINKVISPNRIKGNVTKHIELEPGYLYKAEPVEYREHEITFSEKFMHSLNGLYDNFFGSDKNWKEARVAVMWNEYSKGGSYNDQASFASVFKSVNIRVDTIFLHEPMHLERFNILVVPQPVIDSLSPKDYDDIVQFVNKGGNLITDTKSDLATEFGFAFTKTRIQVNKLRDKYYPEESISWRYSELVNKCLVVESDETFCFDQTTDASMVIGRKVGKGKIIYINSRFDPDSPMGYSRYPFVLHYMRKYFETRPIFKRNNLEVYFDPGFRHTFSVENLVKQWVIQGIRIIHVAGWHEYPKYTYDYQRLINLCHANGILVYAWIEPPQVSQKFWKEHPEWREKNYKGDDIQPSWRYPVALTDPQCVVAMTEHYKKLLSTFDFDGVNLAELYFEAGRGFENANLFTPMHATARSDFKKYFGFDPVNLFSPSSSYYWKNNSWAKNAMVNYRINKIDEVYEKILGSIQYMEKTKPGFKIIVTAMDSFGSPELKEQIGVDMEHILKLQKKFGFMLQVEDPQGLWSTDPMRYIDIGKKYEQLIGDRNKLLLDLNILSFRKKEEVTPFPTLIQTGTECFWLINAASLGSPRSTIYAESSINPQDMLFLSNAYAAGLEYDYIDGGYEVKAPYSFFVQMPNEVKEIRIDGIPLAPSRNNEYLIPAGTHKITTSKEVVSFSAHELQTRILSFTGNLLQVAYGQRDVSLTYEADGRALISLNRKPTSVKVDGEEYPCKPLKGNDCFSIYLPEGKHQVDIVAGDLFTYGVNVTSLWSITGIAILGSIGVGLLLIMYVAMKLIKRRYSKLNSSGPASVAEEGKLSGNHV